MPFIVEIELDDGADAVLWPTALGGDHEVLDALRPAAADRALWTGVPKTSLHRCLTVASADETPNRTR
ncbi:hypothetical protein BIV25_33810 [Streptomyces sp. MUSC 14]|uniref:hypothetical protein n=1 Tax=Streptomyces sp. MUSC 14 TaxID=1354889 RepID=UPI0008F5BA55|nr:hypothetical protein [Streptomyces sp. MUSC 14]OIJ89435.1 hypothetical protein BIV25_33810 [Streptomyces sp. MUSC 14]